MNFFEDRDVGFLYLSTKFELDQSTNNGDLLSDMNHWKDRQTHTQTSTSRTELCIGYVPKYKMILDVQFSRL